MADQEGNDEHRSCLQKISDAIIGTLENGFARLGLKIAKHPVPFMVVCVIICLLTGIGLLEFREESEPDKLWLPFGAKIRDNKAWVDENFPSTTVREKMLATGSNVLKADVIKALQEIYDESLTLETSSELNLTDVCLKANDVCIVEGILEVWSFNKTKIEQLTDEQVLTDIQSTTISPVYGKAIDYTTYLGQITYNGSQIVGAKAALMIWYNDETKSGTEAWEEKFISLGKRGHSSISTLYVLAGRSWSDESSKAIQSDVLSLSIGYFLVIIFVLLVLGKLNFKEQKAWLTVGGIFCVGLSILVSIGLSSAMQQFYGPVQSVLPFLLLGLGVDDMFVIMGALHNLSPEEQKQDIPQKVSAVLRHAGVSITVTSFTDFVAFMIGATTIIPALRSFCVYAGIGVLALYLLQAIFFTACLTLDLRRSEQNRGACCCMMKYGDDYKPNNCSQTQIIPLVFEKVVGPFLSKLPVKIIVIVIAATLFGVNLYGFTELEVYFDRDLFLPSDSYAYQYIKAEKRYFPSTGSPADVYCGQLSYFSHENELDSLDDLMKQSSYIINGTTDSWFAALKTWLGQTTDAAVLSKIDAVTKYPTSETNLFNLTYSLAKEQAPRTDRYIRFVSDSDHTITASRFPMVHTLTSSVDEEIAVMDDALGIVSAAGFSSSECFPYSRAYLSWETNKIIQEELFRNIGLAMLCVFLVSLLLIANLITSFFVLICVVATLIDVAGTMHFWGLTIDTVTSVILILSVGLAVDYSAHIGHMFMTVKGSRQERVKETNGQMGPPVFYGGFSTFLAFALLANSNSYVFTVFFKLNFLTVLYGLFHGLVFLPVILSMLGPAPYPNAKYFDQNRSSSPQNNKVDEEGKGVDNSSYELDKKPQVNGDHSLQTLPPLPPIDKGIDDDATALSNVGVHVHKSAPTGSSQSSDSPPPSYTSMADVEDRSHPV